MAELRDVRLPEQANRADRVGSAGLVLAGAALFGTVGTAQALGPAVPSAQLAAARLLLTGLLLVVLTLAGGHGHRLAGYLRQSPAWRAAVGQAGFNLCFLGAMRETGVAVGTLVAIGATPIVTGVATRQVSRGWLAATGVAVSGLALLVGGQMAGHAGSAAHASVLGVALALGASASYATYIVGGNESARRGLETVPFLAVSFSLSALFTLPVLLVGGPTWVATGGGAAMVGYLAVVPTVVAYSLFNRGLSGVRASTASTLGLIEPVVAAVLAYVVLGERLSPAGVVGACTILVGLLMIVRTMRSAASTEVRGMTQSPGA